MLYSNLYFRTQPSGLILLVLLNLATPSETERQLLNLLRVRILITDLEPLGLATNGAPAT